MRRPVADLVARYTLEPTVLDFFVEGPGDRMIVDWYLRQIGAKQASVYEIDVVEVPLATQQGGNKQRVVTLAQLLTAQAGEGRFSVGCIADRDLDEVVGGLVEDRHLVFTEGSSLDDFLLEPYVLDKFQMLYLQRKVAEPTVLIDLVRPVLTELFITRASDRMMGLGLGSLSPVPNLKIQRSEMTLDFDLDGFHKRYLNRGAKHRVEEFLETRKTVRATVESLGISAMNGPDMVEVLCHVLRPYVTKKNLLAVETAKRALRACLEVRAIEGREPFRTIGHLCDGSL